MTRSHSRTRRLAAAALVASGALVLLAVTPAEASYVQYALYFEAHESTPKYSAVATVRGGQGYVTSNQMRMYVQTMSGTALVASAFGNDGSSVTLSHVPYSGAKSRCYWDYVGGTVAGNPTLPINCWRLQ
jgi:hypothetical protein